MISVLLFPTVSIVHPPDKFQTVFALFPLQRLVALMPEGRGVAMPALAAIHPKLGAALVEPAVDARLQPYFEALRASAVTDSLIAGFKFIRPEEEEPAAPEIKAIR